MKWLRYLLIALISIVVIGAIGVYIFYLGFTPNYSGKKELTALKAPSKVVFDQHAIPHIYAENNEDAFRTLGYIHASERLFQMDLLRRVGSGRLAEIFGKDLKKVDALFRTLGTTEIAKASYKAYFTYTNDDYHTLTQAYQDGINQFIAEGNLPIEFSLLGYSPEDFTPEDIYHTVAYMGFSFAMALKTDPIADYIHRELGPQYIADLSLHSDSTNVFIPVDSNKKQLDAEPIAQYLRNAMSPLPIPEFSGSNAWIIGAKKSKSGKVLFANDTHIGYSQPSVWYEAHISTPSLQLYGNFLAGFPFPLIGHTQRHAWGLTMLENDDFDLYREKVDNGKVLYKGKWIPITSREEIIHVKDDKDYKITVEETPHGPLISNVVDGLDSTEAISAYWTMTKFPMDVLAVGHGLAFAKNIHEFETSIQKLAAPGLNIMYADQEDNIAWWGTAKLLKRPPHVNPKLILDGSTGKDDPLGFYSFDQNPKSINPESGYVYSANNQPASNDSSLYPGYYYAGNRAKVIMENLDASNNWTIDKVKALQLNNTSPSYPKTAKEFTASIQANTAIEKAALIALQSWNGEHNPTSVGPTIYYKQLYHVLKLTFEDELGQENFESYLKSYFMLRSNPTLMANDSSIWWDNVETKTIETKDDIFQLAFEKSVQELFIQLGENVDNWHWRNVHKVTHEHPIGKVEPLNQLFNVGPMSIDGGEEVVNKQSFLLNGNGYYKVKGGPAMRIIIDFADVENSISILPTGQSGNPFSDFYQDQAKMFVNGTYRKQHMNKADIEKEAIGTIEFSPN